MYTCYGTRIAWNGVCSDSFSVLNGVNQGGVFSPVLFCIYFDVLLCRLAESKIGCYIGNVFEGALAYADDIALFASTTRAMRLMLGICEDLRRNTPLFLTLQNLNVFGCNTALLVRSRWI